jgi:hypothetical protein
MHGQSSDPTPPYASKQILWGTDNKTYKLTVFMTVHNRHQSRTNGASQAMHDLRMRTNHCLSYCRRIHPRKSIRKSEAFCSFVQNNYISSCGLKTPFSEGLQMSELFVHDNSSRIMTCSSVFKLPLVSAE